MTELSLTRRLLLDYGWNTTCYQIVNPGISRWFGQEAAVGFVLKAGVRVVAGAPVCALEDVGTVVKAWETSSKRPVCYFGAEARMLEHSVQAGGYSSVVVGAQPVWSPESLIAKCQADASIRAQKSRALNKRVRVDEWPPERAENDPELHRILEEWLATRGLPPMHFLVEPETLAMLAGRRIFVATRDDKAVGFLVLSPIPARRGWLTEQFVRGTDAPNGTIELMMLTAVEAIARDGDEFVTMGIVPLAKLDGFTEGNPLWLRALMKWARAHGRRFYNFAGLEWFKDKFHPDHWEPIYVISREPNFSLRTLYAVAQAFTDSSPLLAVCRGLAKAVRVETRKLFTKR